jgi:hypothetical protein
MPSTVTSTETVSLRPGLSLARVTRARAGDAPRGRSSSREASTSLGTSSVRKRRTSFAVLSRRSTSPAVGAGRGDPPRDRVTASAAGAGAPVTSQPTSRSASGRIPRWRVRCETAVARPPRSGPTDGATGFLRALTMAAATTSGSRWSGSIQRTHSRSAKRRARVRCSALGPVRGISRVGVPALRSSTVVLYPAIATTRSARAMRPRPRILRRTSTMVRSAACRCSACTSAVGMKGPVTTRNSALVDACTLSAAPSTLLSIRWASPPPPATTRTVGRAGSRSTGTALSRRARRCGSSHTYPQYVGRNARLLGQAYSSDTSSTSREP